MAERVELLFRQAAIELISEGRKLLVAVSGGADSVCLLHLLRRYARTRSIDLIVAHLDHGLRPGSRSDRRFVEQLAVELELRCVAERREVRSARRRDESLEEAARRVRRAFLLDVAARTEVRQVATGHTLDDQAETVLMRLVRGAGATALTGMAASGPGPFVRPLLRVERAEIRSYLQRKAIPFRDDPTNHDLRHDRNRVRQLVLPVLTEVLNPRSARHLVQAADRFREDALHLDALAEQAYAAVAHTDRDQRLILRVAELSATPAPIAKRIVRLALQQVGIDPRRIAARHVDALLALPRSEGDQLDLPSAVQARRDGRSRIILAKRDQA